MPVRVYLYQGTATTSLINMADCDKPPIIPDTVCLSDPKHLFLLILLNFPVLA